jgi:hypothetical protein
MVDVAVASPPRVAFKQELDRRIQRLSDSIPGNTNKTQLLRMILVETFINAVHREAAPGNIAVGFQQGGIIPFNTLVVLE